MDSTDSKNNKNSTTVYVSFSHEIKYGCKRFYLHVSKEFKQYWKKCEINDDDKKLYVLIDTAISDDTHSGCYQCVKASTDLKELGQYIGFANHREYLMNSEIKNDDILLPNDDCSEYFENIVESLSPEEKEEWDNMEIPQTYILCIHIIDLDVFRKSKYNEIIYC